MRYALTDAEWKLIEPVLPSKPRGVPRVDDGRVLNGSSGYRGPVRDSALCPSATARTPPATIGSCDGEARASGTAS